MSSAIQTRIGLLTDIHYDGGCPAMNRLYDAIALLKAGGVDALVVMGDLVNAEGEAHAKRLLQEVAALCDAYTGPTYFMPGNHDLDHISKAEFYNALGHAGNAARFDFETGGYKIICIDGNFSPNGNAYELGNFEWQKAFVPEEQLDWLRGRLAASLLPVVVISHQRIDKESSYAVRNHADVRDVLFLSDKVKAVLQGHNHEDDLIQAKGVSFYTLSAHADDAGPAVMQLDSKGVRLIRDYEPSFSSGVTEEANENNPA
ncbi:MAG: metallophosphoesterase [Pontiella sp.]|nr:metallophosphoesterase [Pontiella sp.]MBT8046139.1 metallophosphoesterase [Pontiella sp.]NNJ70542.1 hypothetical protein [Kiritimatiellales bacterium]